MIVRSQLVPLVLRRLADDGIRVALPDGAAADELDIEALHEFLEAAEKASARPWLGIELALERPVGLYGVAEFLYRSAATVREGLVAIAEHSRLLNDVARLELSEGRVASFVQRVDHPIGMGRHANEFFVAMLVREIRALVSDEFHPVRARFAHAMPAHDLAPLTKAVGTTSFVWNDASGIDFDPKWLDAKIVTADPPLAAALRAHTRAWLPWIPARSEEGLVGKLRALVRTTLGSSLSVPSAAQKLGISARTLQRRLADDGVSFQTIVDETLAEHACQLVDSGAGVKEVTEKLGYASTAAFLRAFKRWTGETPTAWREKRLDRRDR